ncbi:hypothetical protein HK104_003078 [Borealophlyctis nickersoniae]|nr:hypothetical protein HK104_003078 [Borealophlyctis nickersoniae]
MMGLKSRDKKREDTTPELGEVPRAVLAVAANKMDLPSARHPDDVIEAIETLMEKVDPDGIALDWALFPICARTGRGLEELVSWVCERIGVEAPPLPVPAEDHSESELDVTTPIQPPLDELRHRIDVALANPSTEPNEKGRWLNHFERLEVIYRHFLRIRKSEQYLMPPGAYDRDLLTVEAMVVAVGTSVEHTVHVSMTTFWCRMVACAVRDFEGSVGRPASEADFGRILQFRPELASPGLWRQFYSRAAMFACEEVLVPPNIRRLPTT